MNKKLLVLTLLFLVLVSLVSAYNLTIDKVFEKVSNNEVSSYVFYLNKLNLNENNLLYSSSYNCPTGAIALQENRTFSQYDLISYFIFTVNNGALNIGTTYLNVHYQDASNFSTSFGGIGNTHTTTNFSNPYPLKYVKYIEVYGQRPSDSNCVNSVDAYGFANLTDIYFSNTNKTNSNIPNGTYVFNNFNNPYYNSASFNFTNTSNVVMNVTSLYTSNLSLNSTPYTSNLTSCNYTITGLTYPLYSEIVSGSPNSSVGLINGSYNVVDSCSGFASSSKNVTINSVSQGLNFFIYTINSFDIRFYDEITKSLLISNNVSLQIISDVYSNNYSTSNGSLYIDLLTPSIYVFRYKSLPNYVERFYLYQLDSLSYNNLSLYLVNGSQTITLTVKDQNDNIVSGAVIKVQRYDLATNSYITREIVSSDTFGNAYFQGILNTEFYKFIVEYPFGTQVLLTSADYLRSTSLTLRINLEAIVFTDFFSVLNTFGSLSFNNATDNFVFDYNGISVSQGCLYVYSNDVLLNSTCVSSSASQILLNVVNSSGASYVAKGTVFVGGVEYLLDVESKVFDKSPSLSTDNKKMFLLLTILLVMIIGFLTLWNITVFLMLTPLPLFIMSLVQLIPISRGVGVTVYLVALTLAVLIAKRS